MYVESVDRLNVVLECKAMKSEDVWKKQPTCKYCVIIHETQAHYVYLLCRYNERILPLACQNPIVYTN